MTEFYLPGPGRYIALRFPLVFFPSLAAHWNYLVAQAGLNLPIAITGIPYWVGRYDKRLPFPDYRFS